MPRRYGISTCALLIALIGTTVAVSVLRGAASGQKVSDRDLQPGLLYQAFDIGSKITSIPTLAPDQKPNVAKVIESVAFQGQANNFLPLTDLFATRITGYLKIRKSGVYHFRLRCDDGGRLFVDDTLRINHDGMHGASGKSCQLSLRKGLHPIVIEHFDGGGGDALILDWRLPSMKDFAVAPSQLFFCPKDVDLNTAAGRKKTVTGPPTKGLEHEEAIDRAVELGIEYLLAEIKRKQPELARGDKNTVGQAALEVYALVVAGVPQDDPLIRASFEYIDKHVLDEKNTYSLSCTIMAHGAAITQLELDEMLISPGVSANKIINKSSIGKHHRRQIHRVGKALLEAQNQTGGWRYFPHETTGDISCTQFAILGLGIAEKRGMNIPLQSWTAAMEFILTLQPKKGPKTDARITLDPDEQRRRDDIALVPEDEAGKRRGGKRGESAGHTGVAKPRDPVVGTEEMDVFARHFGYMVKDHGPKMNSSWNRTCAAVSSLLLIREKYGSSLPADKRDTLTAAIRDGYGWMMENWNPYPSFYGIYSLEKVGDLGRVQNFGERDWYLETSKKLIEMQTRQGHWPRTDMWGENPRVTTALALLVLKRATSLLTRNPADRIIFTGAGQAADRRADREWVYLPEHDTCVHFPQLQRVLSLRPKRKLLAFLGTVIENYPIEFRPEVIPTLTELKGRVQGRGPQKLLDRSLELVVGSKLPDARAYDEWHQLWARIVLAGDAHDNTVEPDLLVAYRASNATMPLKAAAVRTALRLGLKSVVVALVDDLDNDSPEVREFAYHSIRGFFTQTPPAFDSKSSGAKRAAQIAAVRDWVNAQP